MVGFSETIDLLSLTPKQFKLWPIFVTYVWPKIICWSFIVIFRLTCHISTFNKMQLKITIFAWLSIIDYWSPEHSHSWHIVRETYGVFGKYQEYYGSAGISVPAGSPVHSFVRLFWCFFRFTTPIIAVHLQNANAMFHKAAWKHYSGKAENVYITVWRIYSGQYTPNLIRIGWVSFEIWQEHFGVFWFTVYKCQKMEVFQLSHKVSEGSLHIWRL